MSDNLSSLPWLPAETFPLPAMSSSAQMLFRVGHL